jgi:leucyl-tRNA synthetase
VVIAPIMPHLAEELWFLTGHRQSVHTQSWPAWNPEILKNETVEIPVQINGRMKAVISVERDADEFEVKSQVLSDEKIGHLLKDRRIMSTHFVQNRVINLVLDESESE